MLCFFVALETNVSYSPWLNTASWYFCRIFVSCHADCVTLNVKQFFSRNKINYFSWWFINEKLKKMMKMSLVSRSFERFYFIWLFHFFNTLSRFLFVYIEEYFAQSRPFATVKKYYFLPKLVITLSYIRRNWNVFIALEAFFATEPFNYIVNSEFSPKDD